MALVALKFGGTSVGEASRFQQVKNIVQADSRRRAVVVSAPGKADGEDNKITDLLYLCYAHVKYGVDHTAILAKIQQRYQGIAEGLGLAWDAEAEFSAIADAIAHRADEDFLVSRGEYLCARLMARYLDYTFIDARGHIFFHFDGTVDMEKTTESLQAAYAAAPNGIVVPGFYGTMPGGEVRLMTRGGSDITGAIVAAALDAALFENWTDVPGLLMTDPGIVTNPLPIPRITFSELRELTYMGAKVLHEESLFPVRIKKIPINIRSTTDPDAPGTYIQEAFEEESSGSDTNFITGIAGKRDYTVIAVHKSHIGSQLGIIRSILEVFQQYSLHIESMPSGIDGFSVVVATEAVRPHLYSVMTEVEKVSGEGTVRVTEGISLIAAVGRKMVLRPGISGRLFAALGKNNINIRLIIQGTEELSIIVGVGNKDFEKTIRILYDSFALGEAGADGGANS